jgi:hypothetical protein
MAHPERPQVQEINGKGERMSGEQLRCEDERLKAAEQRLIATGSQVNVAEQRLKDTQSQGDDSPATPLRLTSSSVAINRSEAAPRSSLTVIMVNIKQANSVVQGSFCLFMLWHIKKNDTFVMNMWQLWDNCKRLTKL